MSLDSAPVDGEGTAAPITVVTPASDTASYSTPRDAMKDVLAFRRKNAESQAGQSPSELNDAGRKLLVERSTGVEGEQSEELAEEANAAPPEEVPGETQEAEPAEQLPPIEPPRSWTKEEKDEFQTYPRSAQEAILRRAQDMDRVTRQSQNEAAEQRKALERELAAATQARHQYDKALPNLLEVLQQKQLGEFSDIQSIADLQTLAVNDPARFVQYQAKQMEIAGLQQEAAAAQQRQQTEFQEKWTTFAQKEDQLLLDKVPELADQEKAGKLRESAVTALRENFKDQELGDLWNGKASLSLRDHRVQLLIMKAVKYDEAQKAAKQAVAKPIAPVQRPGVAPQKGQAQQEVIQNLTKRLDRTGSMKDAAELLTAQRKAVRRN